MNFFNLGAPKLIPYAYIKLTDSLLKRWYTRSINHCSQLSTTWLSNHGSHSKSKWLLLGLWGDGVIIVLECNWFSFYMYKTYTFILIYLFLCACTFWKRKENQHISRITACPLVIGCLLFLMPEFIRQASKHDAQSLGLMSHHLMLTYWAS